MAKSPRRGGCPKICQTARRHQGAASLTKQRYKHLYLVSCRNDQRVVTGFPLSCRFQNNTRQNMPSLPMLNAPRAL